MQNTYYIIDKARMLHTVKAGSLDTAKDVYNDAHKVRLDIIDEATVCPICKGIHKPDLPDYITYKLAPGEKLCYHYDPQPKPQYFASRNDRATVQPETQFFEHSKRFA